MACPASLVIASKPQRSSAIPNNKTIPLAKTIPVICPVCANALFSKGSWFAIPIEMAIANQIANPPHLGVGVVCTSRFRTYAIAPNRSAAFSASGVSR